MRQYHVERLKHFLFKTPDRRGEQDLYFAKAEAKMVKDWGDSAVWEPLAILLGGGRDKIAEGQAKLKELRKLQVQNYIQDLKDATFTRSHLNGRLQDLLA